jgi:hypothetical protein
MLEVVFVLDSVVTERTQNGTAEEPKLDICHSIKSLADRNAWLVGDQSLASPLQFRGERGSQITCAVSKDVVFNTDNIQRRQKDGLA